jgi:trans-2,3-dihydro-3-hydroxyanthranilate isomerase
MLTLPYVVCDVFTDRPLAGNQLAVFTDGAAVPEDLYIPLAREMNFSETVFALPPEHGGDARIRIFTPTHELPFAGHPVLGSAVVIGGATASEHVRLETGAGTVPVSLSRTATGVDSGWMHQPLPRIAPFAESGALCAALGVSESVLPVEVYDIGPRHVYVAVASPDEVAGLAPDLAALGRFGDLGFSVFAGAGDHWKSRMFAPGLGVPEDPATGSAAGPLALHLARHGQIAFGRQIEISQGIEIGRPSRLLARVTGSADRVEAVAVGGDVVVVADGTFRLLANR